MTAPRIQYMSACGMADKKIFMVGGWENDTGLKLSVSFRLTHSLIQNPSMSSLLTTTKKMSGAKKAKWVLREALRMLLLFDFHDYTGPTNFLNHHESRSEIYIFNCFLL